MEPDELLELLGQEEGERLEFKREWHDLGSSRGKAEFAKDVLAMANVLGENERGHLIFGVEDRRHGGAIVGVEKPPSPEQIAQLLAHYCRPIPVFVPHLRVPYQGRDLSVLEISWSRSSPHYSIRDLPGVLSTASVYTRHGSTVGTLTLPELESLIRAKDRRLGHPRPGPLIVGFVSLPDSSLQEVSIRIQNRTEEPVEGISLLLDVWLPHPKPLLHRSKLLLNAALEPGTVREVSTDLRRLQFYDQTGEFNTHEKGWHRWLDLVLQLTYRDREGLLQEITCKSSIG